MVVQAVYNFFQFSELRKSAQLFKHGNCFCHRLHVEVGDGRVGDAEFRIGIRVVLVVCDDDRGVVAEFFASHVLDVDLNGALAYSVHVAFVLVQGIGAGVNQVF